MVSNEGKILTRESTHATKNLLVEKIKDLDRNSKSETMIISGSSGYPDVYEEVGYDRHSPSPRVKAQRAEQE